MNTRDRLIETATNLLDSGGVAAVTLREVGARSGVSRQAPYRHFADKEALLAAIAARELDAIADLIRAHDTSAADPVRALRAVLTIYFDWAFAHPERFALVFGRWINESADLERAATAAWELILDATGAAQASGHFPAGPPERLAALIRSTAHGAVALQLGGHLAEADKGGVTASELIDDLFKALGASNQRSVR